MMTKTNNSIRKIKNSTNHIVNKTKNNKIKEEVFLIVGNLYFLE